MLDPTPQDHERAREIAHKLDLRCHGGAIGIPHQWECNHATTILATALAEQRERLDEILRDLARAGENVSSLLGTKGEATKAEMVNVITDFGAHARRLLGGE